MRAQYRSWAGDEESDQPHHEPPADPGVDRLFGTSVYLRGALTLHALRLTVGDDAFFTILRAWASRYQYSNVSTEDFIGLAKELTVEVSDAELEELFDAWLFEEEVPVLPEAPE